MDPLTIGTAYTFAQKTGVVETATNFVGNLFGNGADDKAIAQYYDGLVSRLGANIIGPLALYTELQDGIFEGKSVRDWDGSGIAGTAGPLERDFFRFLAVNVGAIDAGYRQRSGGADAALQAFQNYAREIDKLAGSNLAAWTGQTTASPFKFYEELMRIPVAKMAEVNRYFINDPGLPGALATTYTPQAGPTGVAGDTQTSINRVLSNVGQNILDVFKNVFTGAVQGAAAGAQTASQGAATGSSVGSRLTNPIFVVLLIVGVVVVARLMRGR